MKSSKRLLDRRVLVAKSIQARAQRALADIREKNRRLGVVARSYAPEPGDHSLLHLAMLNAVRESLRTAMAALGDEAAGLDVRVAHCTREVARAERVRSAFEERQSLATRLRTRRIALPSRVGGKV